MVNRKKGIVEVNWNCSHLLTLYKSDCYLLTNAYGKNLHKFFIRISILCIVSYFENEKRNISFHQRKIFDTFHIQLLWQKERKNVHIVLLKVRTSQKDLLKKTFFPKKNEQILLCYYKTSSRLVFALFLEEIEDTKRTFRSYLTFTTGNNYYKRNYLV